MKLLARIVSVVSILSMFVAIGCGSGLGTTLLSSGGAAGASGTDGTDSGTDSESESAFALQDGDSAFYSAAMNTTPTITATTSNASISAKSVLDVSNDINTWDSGSPPYEIFEALREYQFPRDEGVIDVSNIYKLLHEAGNNYDNALNEVEELETPTEIIPPFDFGSEIKTFTHASSGDALVREDNTISAILTWIWDEQNQIAYGVVEGSLNEQTGDLVVDMAYLVDYEGESDYCVRSAISGNEETHEFVMRLGKVGTTEGAHATSIIGVGVSQSEDPDDYFLLKVINNGNLSEYPEGRYFKVPASATEDDLRSLPVTGQALEDIDDPDNRADIIEEMEFLQLDGSDHATSVEDFSNTSLELNL